MSKFRGRTNSGMIMIPEEEFKEARDREDAAIKALARVANKKHALQSRIKELEHEIEMAKRHIKDVLGERHAIEAALSDERKKRKELEAINLGLTKTLVEMEAEKAELRKDAERYQYIRRNQTWHRYDDYSLVGAKFDYADDFQAAILLDYHIDRRLQQQADDEGKA